MKLDKAVGLVVSAEEDLAEQLGQLAGRHASEHDVYHMAHTVAQRSRDHLSRLTPIAEQLGTSAPNEYAGEGGRLQDALHRTAAAVLGRTEATGMLLLLDLRTTYLTAQHAEVSWVILLQAAKAARHRELTELSTSCHEEVESTAKWLRTRIKETAPQALATG